MVETQSSHHKHLINNFFSVKEFLLGETILAAPIVEKDAYKRDIYLPVGSWKDGNSDTVYKGKRWIRNYDAPIDVLPYFIRQN